MKHPITEFKDAQLVEWLASIDYYQIRSVETMLPAVFSDGRRVRGLMLTADICIARNRKLYRIADGQAYELSGSDIRRLGLTVAHLKQRFVTERSSVLQRRRTQGVSSGVLTTQPAIAPK